MRIFISYRRDDTAGYAGRLHDRLVQHYGKDNIFMDIDTIEPGQDFVEAVGEAVGSCNVLIALMGKQWLTVTDSQGRRRVDDPHDWIRLEVANALARNVRVIPALVRGMIMPGVADLPDDLAMLARRQAVELSDHRFHEDVDRLIQAIDKALDESDARPIAPTATRPAPAPTQPAPEPPAPVATPPAASPTPPAPRPDSALGQTILKYAALGYTEAARTEAGVVMTQRAPLNVVLLIGWLLLAWPVAIVHAIPSVRKLFRLELKSGPGGAVQESGDTPAVIAQHKKTTTRNGWILIAVAIGLGICIFSITFISALGGGY